MFFHVLIYTCINLIYCTSALPPKPHLFTIVIDDLGWTDLGSYGAEYDVPFLDELILKESVLLNQYYIQPTCSPSRSSFITGRYPFHLGLQPVQTIAPCSEEHIPLDVPTIAESLKSVGYQTHAFGKWHLGYGSPKYTPKGRGFDSFSGLFQGAGDYNEHTFCLTLNKTEFCGFDWFQDDEPDYGTKGTYTNDIIFEKTMNMVQNYDSNEGPLFAYIAWQTIHAPITAPPKNFTECENIPFWRRQVYCNKLNYLSVHLEALFTAIRDNGLWENSLIVVTTDNGGMPNHVLNGYLADGCGLNHPLRAGKATVFEGGVRGVGFITGGLLPSDLKGKKSNSLLHAVDIVTGQLAAAGLPFDKTDGVDIFDAVFNDTKGHDMIILDLHRKGDPDLVATASAIRIGAWKYMEGATIYDGYFVNATGPPIPAPQNCTEGCLFNIANDPNEKVDLSSKFPAIVSKAKRELEKARLPTNGYVKPSHLNPDVRCMLKSARNGTWLPWMR